VSSRLIPQGHALRVAAQALTDHPRLHKAHASGWKNMLLYYTLPRNIRMVRRLRFVSPLDSLPQCAMMELYFLTFKPMSSRGELTLPLVKVKEKFQVTIPTELREALHLTVGDLLEATIENDTIVLKPKAVVDRTQAWNGVIEVIERVHAKQRPHTQDPKKEEEEITREIKEYRKQHARSPHRSH